MHRALRHGGHRHLHFPSREELDAHDPLQSATPPPTPISELHLTPWVLFVAITLGPCEPLIPVLMYPAATSGWPGVALVAGVFAIATLTAMSLAVWIGVAGVERLPLGRLERFSHALAGGAIFASGLGVTLLGL